MSSTESATKAVTVAAGLRARAGAILRRWEESARSASRAWAASDFDSFRHGIPPLVEEIAEALAEEPVPGNLIPCEAAADPIPPFPGVRLEVLAAGLGLLRRILPDEVASATGREPTLSEIVAIGDAIDGILIRWITAATTQRTDDADEQRKLLSFLSHDLRGGLNGVFLMIEIVKRELARHPQFAESVQDLDGARKSMMDTLTTLDQYVNAEKQRRAAMKP